MLCTPGGLSSSPLTKSLSGQFCEKCPSFSQVKHFPSAHSLAISFSLRLRYLGVLFPSFDVLAFVLLPGAAR